MTSITGSLLAHAQQQPHPRQLGPNDTQTKGTKLVTFKMCKGSDGKFTIAGGQPKLPTPFEGEITMGPDGDGYLMITKPYKKTIQIYKSSAECKVTPSSNNASGAVESSSSNMGESGEK
jgi:hypothetical protein